MLKEKKRSRAIVRRYDVRKDFCRAEILAQRIPTDYEQILALINFNLRNRFLISPRAIFGCEYVDLLVEMSGWPQIVCYLV